jgi:hypothetical protein
MRLQDIRKCRLAIQAHISLLFCCFVHDHYTLNSDVQAIMLIGLLVDKRKGQLRVKLPFLHAIRRRL